MRKPLVLPLFVLGVRPASMASPSPRTRASAVASVLASGAAGAASAEIIGVASQTDQKLILKVQPSRTKVPTGQLRFVAENTGDTVHALRIVGNGIDVTTDDFGAGASQTINIVLSPGQCRLVCPIPGHEQQGMAATLTVVGPEA